MRRHYFKYRKRFLLYVIVLLVLICLFINQIMHNIHQPIENLNELFLIFGNNDEKQWHHSINSFSSSYSNLIKCSTLYARPWSPPENITAFVPASPLNIAEYARPASNETHLLRLTRAVLVYFPIESSGNFEPEFKWLYRSWIEMQKYEPKMWRTDLIIFLERNEKLIFFEKLNCTYKNVRHSKRDMPMCTLIEFVPLQKRSIREPSKRKASYEYVLNHLNIFDDGTRNLAPFYWLMKSHLVKYGYLNSILMAFEGYEYFKIAKYDFLIRSDMDVFLTPLFGKWVPPVCNSFVVGGGGFSTEFNNKRLKRINQALGMSYAGQWNLGSTWYSTPAQFRLVSFMTLFGMAYLSSEEFAQPEREGKLGVELWPDWHYGVLLLYGQSLGLNHLIATNQLNVLKLEGLIDYGSGNLESIFNKLHIHVFHGGDMFSKFVFKTGAYDKMKVSDENATLVKYYALKMALEGKLLGEDQLASELKKQGLRKE